MSIEAMVWVLNNSRARSVDRLVMLVLANYANDDGEAWPSGRTLAAKAAVSRQTVVDALARNVALGELAVVVAGDPRHSTRYRFLWVVDNTVKGGPDLDHPPDTSGPDLDTSGPPALHQRSTQRGPDPLVTPIEKDRGRTRDGDASSDRVAIGTQVDPKPDGATRARGIRAELKDRRLEHG